MATVKIIVVALTAILLFSTVVCGLWLGRAGQPADAGSVAFHKKIALATAALTVAMMALMFVN